MTEREEVLLEQGFMLHRRPYRNSSQLLDCLTRDHGRVSLVARASRRVQKAQHALLQPFAPLRLSWVRRRELGSLTYVEAGSGGYALSDDGLLAGFYVNELILRLVARGDPNAEVFNCYTECIAALERGAGVARTVRIFELALLSAIGYGLSLDCDTHSGEPLRPEQRYMFELESGARPSNGSDDQTQLYWGRELISLRDGDLSDRDSLRAAKRLLGGALNVYLGDRPLRSRAVFREIFDRRAGRERG